MLLVFSEVKSRLRMLLPRIIVRETHLKQVLFFSFCPPPSPPSFPLLYLSFPSSSLSFSSFHFIVYHCIIILHQFQLYHCKKTSIYFITKSLILSFTTNFSLSPHLPTTPQLHPFLLITINLSSSLKDHFALYVFFTIFYIEVQLY